MIDNGKKLAPSSATDAAVADYRLIFSSLERKILANEEPEKTRRILARQDIWQALTTDQKIQWSSLAQMAGAMDTALAVLAAVNRSKPDHVGAWKNRLALLILLERREEIAKTMAMARKHVPGDILDSLPRPHRLPDSQSSSDMGLDDNAFDRFRLRERQIARFMNLFSGRQGGFCPPMGGSPQSHARVCAACAVR